MPKAGLTYSVLAKINSTVEMGARGFSIPPKKIYPLTPMGQPRPAPKPGAK